MTTGFGDREGTAISFTVRKILVKAIARHMGIRPLFLSVFRKAHEINFHMEMDKFYSNSDPIPHYIR